MKIVSLIPSYKYNPQCTDQVLIELNKISKTILFTASRLTNSVAADVVFCDASLGRDLVYETRKWVINNLDGDWDYILYNEDDILIPTQSIENVLKLYKQLPNWYIPGFIRYEVDNNHKRYIDMHPAHAIHRGGYGSIKQTYFEDGVWEPWNLHTGNWLLSKHDIKNLIDKSRFEVSYNQYGLRYGNCDQLESSATSLYLNYTKVYPIDFESVECWHMPNKYITMLDVKNGNPTAEELKQLIYAHSNT